MKNDVVSNLLLITLGCLVVLVMYIFLTTKRQKLDDKSFRCVLLSLNEESKAYRLYDLVSKKVVISRDIMFEENKK